MKIWWLLWAGTRLLNFQFTIFNANWVSAHKEQEVKEILEIKEIDIKIWKPYKVSGGEILLMRLVDRIYRRFDPTPALLNEICGNIEGLKGGKEVETEDGYKWFRATFFQKANGMIAVVFPYRDRAVTLYTFSGITFAEIDPFLRELAKRFLDFQREFLPMILEKPINELEKLIRYENWIFPWKLKKKIETLTDEFSSLLSDLQIRI